MNICIFVLLAIFTAASAQRFDPYYGNVRLGEFYRRNRIPYWAKVQQTPLGLRLFWKRGAVEQQPQNTSVVSCDFQRDKQILRCNRSEQVFVECGAVDQLEKFRFGRFDSFAISAQPIGNISSIENIKYPLYPERPEKNGWKHSKIRDLLTQKVYDHSLYFSQSINDNGFRVVDLVCWNKLVAFLGEVKPTEKIQLGMKPSRVDDAKIIGKIRTKN